MESFRWDRNFVTGLPEVDRQHRYLVGVINTFGDLVARNEWDFDDIEAVFKELVAYTHYHFDAEEALMKRAGMDPLYREKHHEKHNQFLKEVAAMKARITPGRRDSARSLLNFLTSWLAYHILGTDQNMARQIAAIEAGCKPDEAYAAEEKKDDKSTGPLLAALNSLFEQVSIRNRELLELNQTLEEKVTERTRALSEANQRLETIALTDVLTGLPNRRHALQQLKLLWEESLEKKAPLACMMIDADGFKTINDTYGHDAGDEVLRELSRVLAHTVRNDDVVCRLGGDEFLIICPDTPLTGAMVVAENLRKSVAGMRVTAGQGTWFGSISVGVAVRTATMKTPEDLIKSADQGVYAAKQGGRNCVKSVE